MSGHLAIICTARPSFSHHFFTRPVFQTDSDRSILVFLKMVNLGNLQEWLHLKLFVVFEAVTTST